MEFSEAGPALGKLVLIFGVLIALLRLRVKLWLAILAGCLAVALLTNLPPHLWPGLIFRSITHHSLLVLCLMVWLIMILSGVQDANGQSAGLVKGLEAYLRKPRLRLVIFPALVGLLPMPGGALFSCPMLKAAADGMGLSDRKMSLVNYWFRHIWEIAWPLYPGYVLASSLLGLPMTALLRYTCIMTPIAFAIGWFFYLRDLAHSRQIRDNETCHSAPADESLGKVLLNALPIAVTLVGAAFFSLLFARLFPQLPGQLAFSASLATALAVALFQGRKTMSRPLRSIAFNANTLRLLLLLAAIFLFKDTIMESGLVRQLSSLGSSPLMVCVTCVLVPFVSGLLTGIMVGFVGICLPIILGILSQSTLQEYTLPLVILTLAAGNCGQLLSPLHVCLAVTCEYFSTPLASVWKSLVLPVTLLFLSGAVWAAALAFMGAAF